LRNDEVSNSHFCQTLTLILFANSTHEIKDFPPKPYDFGTAKPTISAINPNGVVTKRFADSDYEKRPASDDLLDALD